MNIKFTYQPLLVCATATLISAQSLGTGTLAPIGHLTTERTFQTATLLTSGTVQLAGAAPSVLDGPVLATAELYDPATGTFNLTSDMNRPRVGHSATLLPDGGVLIATETLSSASRRGVKSYNCEGAWRNTIRVDQGITARCPPQKNEGDRK